MRIFRHKDWTISPVTHKSVMEQNTNEGQSTDPSPRRLYHKPNRTLIWLQTQPAESREGLFFKNLSKLYHFQSLKDYAPQSISMRSALSQQSFQFFSDLLSKVIFPLKLTISLDKKDRQENKIVIPDQKKNCLGISLKSYFDWSILASTKAHQGQQYLFSRLIRI